MRISLLFWSEWSSSGCCCSVAELCPTLCDPVDFSMPRFPVLHHFPEFAQTHVHWVNDAVHLLQSQPTSSGYNFCFSSLFWLCRVSVVALSCSMQLGFSCWGSRALERPGPLAPVGLVALQVCGILALQPGIQCTSLELKGGSLTTGPPGKSHNFYYDV